MDVLSEPCDVRYRFGCGEAKIAKHRDTVPIGIKGANGGIAAHRIPNSPTKLVLSITSQKALGVVLDTAAGRADFKAIGLKNVKLRRPREGGWGVRISDFLDAELPQREPKVNDEEVVVYTATAEQGDSAAPAGFASMEEPTVIEETIGAIEGESADAESVVETAPALPLHDVRRATTTAGK